MHSKPTLSAWQILVSMWGLNYTTPVETAVTPVALSDGTGFR